MPRPNNGPKLWLDPKRRTWTILDGRKRIRTGHPEPQRDLAVVAIHQYTNGTYKPAPPPKSHKPNARKGVYVIGFGPYIKIGVTIDLDGRLDGLQTPEPVTVYALIEGWYREEKELHERFAAYRLRGEWFKHEGALAEWIKSLTISANPIEAVMKGERDERD